MAHAAGFEDIPAFINALADEEVNDPRGSITVEERRESVAMIERGNAEIEAGGGIEAEAAIRSIAEKHGLDVPS